MFGAIGRFVVRIADLAEAEGRLAIHGLIRAAMVMFLAAAAMVLGAAAVVMFAIAVYLALTPVMPPGAALALAATMVLIIAGGAAWWARSLHRDIITSASPTPTSTVMEHHQ